MSAVPSDGKIRLTVKELQNKLPIECGNLASQYFTFKDWGMEEEKAISKLKEKHPSMGKFVSAVISLMLNDFGGVQFQTKDENEKKLILNQQPMANVLYMYLYLRYDQLGSEVRLNFTCPYCSHNISDFIANIDDIDVDCKFGNYEKVIDYKLKKPITIESGNQLVEVLKIGIAPWDVMEKADAQSGTDEASMKIHTFRTSIVGVGGELKVLPDKVISKLKKIDIELLHKVISEHNAGPNIQAEIDCTKCRGKSYRHIEWGYDSFFGLGSLPTT